MKLGTIPARIRAASRNLRRQRVSLNPKQYRADSLGIDSSAISRVAVQTVQTLQRAGYGAWLVGGCVRDLLLGRVPKDFDVATDARPKEITPLFRRSRVIGRRFVIVHVPFRGANGGRLRFLEVSTLRRWPSLIDARGIALDDNQWSKKLTDDVVRRDFTANALYLDCVSGTVSDFTGGVEDVASRTLRVIGEPAERFREDPVRMLRLARFRALYDFRIPQRELDALRQCAPMLLHTDRSRRLLETEKLFLTGRAVEAFAALQQLDLLQYLVEQPIGRGGGDAAADLLRQEALKSTDRAVANGFRGHWGWLLSALLWPAVPAKRKKGGKGPDLRAAERLLRAQSAQAGLNRRTQESILESWRLQQVLERGEVPAATLAHPQFRQALWLARIRLRAGDGTLSRSDLETLEQQHRLERPPPQRTGQPRQQRRGGGRAPGRRRRRRRTEG